MFEAHERATGRFYGPMLLFGLLSLTAVASSQADEETEENTRRCIPTRTVTSTGVIDGRNIVFFMVGEPVYHNFLPDRCIGLAERGSFSYESGGLCSGDRIRLADETYQPGNWCEIGDFYRITREDLKALRAVPQGTPPLKPLPTAEVEDISTETDDPREQE